MNNTLNFVNLKETSIKRTNNNSDESTCIRTTNMKNQIIHSDTFFNNTDRFKLFELQVFKTPY